MLQLRNEMPFTPGLFLFPDEKGVETLYPVVKATFTLHGDTLRVAGEQRPLLAGDEHWGAPETSSLKYASEAHLLQPRTGVVLVGEAHAPGGKPVSSCLVSVSVGPLKKVLQVFGDRVWSGGLLAPRPSRPEPFVKLPLTYERAFGGLHVVDAKQGRVLGESRNPVGRGFRGKRAASEMVGLPLPNVEDPGALIGGISDTPAPMGMGFVAPGWEPRKAFAGTYDEAWQKQRAPFLPLDFKPEFFRAASAGLWSATHLRGGEPVALANVSPRGGHRFQLPRCGLDVRLTVAGRTSPVQLRLETVLLEPSEGRVCMLWRGALACDKKVLQAEAATFRLTSLEGVSG